MLMLQERLQEINRRIGNRPVTLVAATKYANPAQMIEAYEAGIRHFGENRVQDALEKKRLLPPEIVRNVTWHMIGHLQRNKVIKTLGEFELIHSIDSHDLAEVVSRKNQEAGRVQRVLLQVNISGEATKHGFSQDAIRSDIHQLLHLPGIEVAGFMTMAPHTRDKSVLKGVFGGLRDLRGEMAQITGHSLPELSMGMSEDFDHAMGCDATIIRIGSYLFRSSIEE